MEGLTIAILGITLLSGVVYSWSNRRGSDALASIAGEFPMTPEQAALIAMEAGLTWRERANGRAVPVTRSGDVLKVEIECGAGVMSFEIRQTPSGSRVTGRAEEIAIVRMPQLGGFGVSPADVLTMTAGMPRNPARLLRRRERVFDALAFAAREGDSAGVDHVHEPETVLAANTGRRTDAGQGRETGQREDARRREDAGQGTDARQGTDAGQGTDSGRGAHAGRGSGRLMRVRRGAVARHRAGARGAVDVLYGVDAGRRRCDAVPRP
ncbi:hypothetical protein ABZT47_19705 [Sphaerisporangium sp. NPDC005289]|uniref:hypothetical protein n=1 Tax=Sphaerisporangium sp. NPDC005289 TaxID=3155247 RepID=UPI0033A16D19